jgi:hypothetical protein
MNNDWPQQQIFIEKVKSFAKANGYTTPRGAAQVAVLARLFNLSESTLKQALYFKSKRRLGYDALSHIAGVVGCSVNDFTGTPSESPPNVAQQKWNEISHEERLFASTVLADVMADQLTVAEKRELFSAYNEMKARLLRLREANKPTD